MKNNKKGFTLIELLAVIVILAIIALIATPIVLNIIDDTKKESDLRSADFYLDALELSIAQATLDGQNLEDKTYNIMPNGNICLKTYTKNGDKAECKDENGKTDNTELVVEVKGEVPSLGTITITSGEISDMSLIYDHKEVIKNFKGELIYNLKLEEMCELKEGTAKTVGAKYSCDLGDGERYFYVLEVGSTPITNSTLKDNEIALILNGNYDKTTQTWCDQNGENPNSIKCNADGLIGKLDEIASAWTKLERSQIGLPSKGHIENVDSSFNLLDSTISKTYDWLYKWEGNDNYGNGVPVGYWTSSPRNPLAWYVDYSGYVGEYLVNGGNYCGVRPVISLKI